jgi:hypothetical protein
VVSSFDVLVSVSVTVTPGTTAPVGSATTPVTAEVEDVVCANAEQVSSSKEMTSKDITLVIFFLLHVLVKVANLAAKTC